MLLEKMSTLNKQNFFINTYNSQNLCSVWVKMRKAVAPKLAMPTVYVLPEKKTNHTFQDLQIHRNSIFDQKSNVEALAAFFVIFLVIIKPFLHKYSILVRYNL